MRRRFWPLVMIRKWKTSIAEVARQEKIGFFSRFALMRKSIDAGVPPSALVSWDGLHHTADGYDCIGRALARAFQIRVGKDLWLGERAWIPEPSNKPPSVTTAGRS